MKMVKSLLLGSAAGLMAVAGAQAADLPVKAAPVEYVKICSLYGAGFYYIPGTDICIKIGGYVRGQYYFNAGNSGTNGYFFTGPAGAQQTRNFNDTNDFIMRTRTILTMDTRAQTEWGTVRAYMNVGWTQDSPFGSTAGVSQAGQGLGASGFNSSSPTTYANRAFIQWAGFTFGKAQSFWDIFPQAARTYHGLPTHDTGDSGQNLAGYTTQWGNGISTTIAIEEPRRLAIFNADTTNSAFVPGVGTVAGLVGAGAGGALIATPSLNNDMANVRWPDLVSNIRIDQAWGSFQLMSAVHDVAAAYNFTNGAWGNCPASAAFNPGVVGGVPPVSSLSGAFNCGYPSDKIGWAQGVGGIFNLPFIAAGDTFAFQVNYAQGATRYVSYVQNASGGVNPAAFGGSFNLGAGWMTDAVTRANINNAAGLTQSGSLELTTSWGAVAAFEHFWTPALRTSWYGGGIWINYDSNATTYICDNITRSAVTGLGAVQLVNAAGQASKLNCNPDFGLWFAGSRTQWNIRPDFYMGVDVLYQHLDTAFGGAFANYAGLAGQPRPASFPTVGNNPVYTFKDQDALSVTFRVHRDIVP